MGKGLNRFFFPKKTHKWPTDIFKKCSTSHQDNENQNHNELSPHHGWLLKRQEISIGKNMDMQQRGTLTLLKCEKDKGCNKDSVLQYQIRVNGSLIIREGLWIPTK